jgi:uncharacterized protein
VVKNSTSARSPLSPTLWPRSAFVWWGSLLLVFGIAVVAFATSTVVGVFLLARYGLNALQHPSAEIALVLQTLGVYIPVVLLLVLALPRLARRSLRELGLRMPTFGDLAWGAAAAATMFVAIEVVGAIEEHFVHTKISETAVDLLKSAHGPILYTFSVFAVVAAPFVEELVFRGFVVNALLRYMPPAIAILLSGVIFGLAHGDAHSLPAIAPLAAGGIVLGAFYHRTGSLAVTMIAHGTFNLISVVGLLAFHAG